VIVSFDVLAQAVLEHSLYSPVGTEEPMGGFVRFGSDTGITKRVTASLLSLPSSINDTERIK
jgi:hypothetical protein